MPSSAKIDTSPPEVTIRELFGVRSLPAPLGDWDFGSATRRFMHVGTFDLSKYKRVYIETVTRVAAPPTMTFAMIFTHEIAGVHYMTHQAALASNLGTVPAVHTTCLSPDSVLPASALPSSSVASDIEAVFPNIKETARATEGSSLMVLRDKTTMILMLQATAGLDFQFDQKIRGVF